MVDMAALLIERGANVNAATNVQYEFFSSHVHREFKISLLITILSLPWLYSYFKRSFHFSVFNIVRTAKLLCI